MAEIKSSMALKVSEIYQRDGEVKPSVLVAEAEPKSSPIHSAFEWDNKKAGHEYRLIQARTYIRNVEIIVEEGPERMVHVPQVSTEYGSEGAYKPISVVAQSSGEYDLAMRETLKTLNAAKASYEMLKKAAEKRKDKNHPNFKRADKGFNMVSSALDAAGS